MGGKCVTEILCFFPQYLPVYTPSEEEKENPSLFANNVRAVMAKYVRSCLFFKSVTCVRWWLFAPLISSLPDRVLEVPLIDLSFEDREIILSEGELRIFDFSSLLEFSHLVCRLGWVDGRLDQPVRLGRLCRPGLWGFEAGQTLPPCGAWTYYICGGKVASCQ